MRIISNMPIEVGCENKEILMRNVLIKSLKNLTKQRSVTTPNAVLIISDYINSHYRFGVRGSFQYERPTLEYFNMHALYKSNR